LEIVEFSPVILNLRTNKIEDSKGFLVKPIRSSKLDKNFKDKTGIQQQDVDKADSWAENYDKLNKWLTEKLGKNSWIFVTDASIDFKVIFPEQMNISGRDLEIHDYYKHYVNIQDIFIKDQYFRKTDELKKLNINEMAIYLNNQNKLNI